MRRQHRKMIVFGILFVFGAGAATLGAVFALSGGGRSQTACCLHLLDN